MAPRTIYANLPDGLQPFTLWDASLADMGSLGVIPCTAAGTNTIVLTPVGTANAPTPAYANNNQFSFVAVATSSGPVSVNVNGLGAKNVYKLTGSTQVNTGDIVSGNFYEIAYSAALNSNAGGFYLLSASFENIAATATPLPDASGAVGTGTHYAREDHVHPASALTGDVTSVQGASATTIVNAWKNTRLAKTANYTVANADKWSTIALGGSAYYTLTFNVASGYDANFGVVVTNEDSTVSGGIHTGRGKIIAINGYPSFILWPGQTFTVINQNNTWRFDYPGRWRVQGLPTLYVNHATGSDSNDGLVTGAAFATIQAAVFAYEFYVDCNGFGPTIQNAAETFTENNVSHTRPLTGYHVISITGDTTTPSNCVWQVSGSGNVAINCRDCGLAIVTGFKFVSTGTGNFFINGSQDGVCDFGSLEFGANSGGYNLYISPGGACNFFGGTMKVSGSAAGMILMSGEGHLLFDGATVNISTPVTIGTWFQASGTAFASMTSMVFTGSLVTGNQYLMQSGAQAFVTGSTIPGTGLGTIFAGAIVYPFVKTNDAAQAGDIGEYIESVIATGSATSLVSGTAKTVTSITLTPGDWDVTATMYINPGATTNFTRYIASISATTNTLDTTAGKYTEFNTPAFVPGSVTLTANVSPYRLTVAFGATLTVFLIADAFFTVSTAAAWGILRARRMR